MIGAVAGCGDPGVDPTPHGQLIPVADRGPAPAISGALVGGGTFDAQSLDGRVSVVNFWGSWCGPCRVEVPELQAFDAAMPDEQVAVLGVNVRDQEDLAQAFLDGRGVSYPSLFDPDGEIALAFAEYPITQTPSTVVVDDTGRVAAVYLGAVPVEDLTHATEALLDETSD
ncbi:TlpA family protein disulfide reductase [Geodermatophilus sp. FMUSA9-8]|uniref:TlpA family protein disulfide reductase n=1 Tax=Geodermatophilus sp. FMUSA9-8 TaxID=3120155 RepID=UPI00300B30A8